MCGIFTFLSKQKGDIFNNPELLILLENNFKNIECRGPDNSTQTIINNNILQFFHRLSIMGTLENGNQPIEISGVSLTCNGEIYNYTKIIEKYDLEIVSDSDCEVIIHLYLLFGIEKTLEELDGVFAFTLIDKNKNLCICARDPIGVRPMFYLNNSQGIYFSSEIKSIINLQSNNDSENNVQIFPPGSYSILEYDKLNSIVDTKENNIEENYFKFYTYYDYEYKTYKNITYEQSKQSIVDLLNRAVAKRMIADSPVGLLISGGLDSSLVAGIACLDIDAKNIHSFSIGLEDSPDLENAKKVADFLGTNHHTVKFTIEEGIEALHKVIFALESYDITTIRASVPHYLISKYIREKTDIKVVLSGEGADEIFGGYLYFHHSPSEQEFQCETERLVKKLHQYDVLRTDRVTAANSLEVRVPFLDKTFLKTVMCLPPEYKRPCNGQIEKKILREAFAEYNLIPNEILFRQKDAFSDACGYGWVPSIKKYADQMINNKEFSSASIIYDNNTPTTKESFLYRKIFESYFPNRSYLIEKIWRPKWTNSDEPSATIYTNIHNSNNQTEKELEIQE